MWTWLVSPAEPGNTLSPVRWYWTFCSRPDSAYWLEVGVFAELFAQNFWLSLRRLRVNMMFISSSVIIEGSSLELLFFFFLLVLFRDAGVHSADVMTCEGSVSTFSAGSFLGAFLILGKVEAAGFETTGSWAFSSERFPQTFLRGLIFFLSRKTSSSFPLGNLLGSEV